MYQHHEESLKIMEKMFREREGVKIGRAHV